MGQRLDALETPLTFPQIARALAEAWKRLEGSDPDIDALALLLAQSALETGNWKKSYCFNLGNAKAGDSWTGDHCFYFADEIVSASQAARAYAQRARRTDGSAAHDVQCKPLRGGQIQVTLWPDHPWCRFRAFRSLEDGANDYVGLLKKRFSSAWPALERGDADSFIGLLKQAGYFTASVDVYLPPVRKLFTKFRKRLVDEAILTAPLLPRAVEGRVTVRKGSKGKLVSEVQTILVASGYVDVDVSGKFDEATRRAVVLFQQQHIDEQGLPLEPDGKVGPKTWWALLNDSGEFQRNRLTPPTSEGLTPDRTKLLELILAEHAKDVREVPNGSNDSKDIRKYWGKTGISKKPWCCAYVSWGLNEALGKLPINGTHHLGVQRMWLEAKKLGMETVAPKPGDVFIQIKDEGTGHTGFVVGLSEDGLTVFTCEGNCGNRLKLGQRPRSSIDHFIDCIRDGQSDDFPRGSNLTFEDVSQEGTR